MISAVRCAVAATIASRPHCLVQATSHMRANVLHQSSDARAMSSPGELRSLIVKPLRPIQHSGCRSSNDDATPGWSCRVDSRPHGTGVPALLTIYGSVDRRLEEFSVGVETRWIVEVPSDAYARRDRVVAERRFLIDAGAEGNLAKRSSIGVAPTQQAN